MNPPSPKLAKALVDLLKAAEEYVFSDEPKTNPCAEVQPTPNKCPVCDGTGLVSRPPGVAGDQKTWVSTETGPWECRVCGGDGILWRASGAS